LFFSLDYYNDVWSSSLCSSNFYNNGSSCVSCASPSSGYYVSSICSSSANTLISPCTITSGNYVISVCVQGSSSVLGSDLVQGPCSSPSTGQFVSAICYPGSTSSLGNNTVIQSCASASLGYIVTSNCSMGSYNSLGSNTGLVCGAGYSGSVVISSTSSLSGCSSTATTPSIVVSVLIGLLVILVLGLLLFIYKKRNIRRKSSLEDAYRKLSNSVQIDVPVKVAMANPLYIKSSSKTSSELLVGGGNIPSGIVPYVKDDTESNELLKGLLRLLNGEVLAPFNLPLSLIENISQNFKFKIGEGGYGEVFEGSIKGNNDEIDVKVAIKRIYQSKTDVLSKSPLYTINSVRKEIALLSEFRHANIIKLIGYHAQEANLRGYQDKIWGEYFYLVYEAGTRGNLATMLHSKGEELNWNLRLKIAIEIASALHYLHTKNEGVPAFHRDLKTVNIVLTESLEAKVIDWGLSKFIPQEVENPLNLSKTTGPRLGTYAYMCPSLLNPGVIFDVKHEIYSYGIVLGEIFTGKLRFEFKYAEDYETLPFDTRGEDLLGDEMIESIREVIKGCIAPYKIRKYETMKEILDILIPLHVHLNASS